MIKLWQVKSQWIWTLTIKCPEPTYQLTTLRSLGLSYCCACSLNDGFSKLSKVAKMQFARTVNVGLFHHSTLFEFIDQFSPEKRISNKVNNMVIIPSAICFSKGTEHSMSLLSLRTVQFRPITHIRRITTGSSKISSSICLRAPARDPSSTLRIRRKNKLIELKSGNKDQLASRYTSVCLLRRSCSSTSAVNRLGRTSSNAATWKIICSN